MWDLILGAVILAPAALMLGREAVAEAVHAVWMRQHDQPARYDPTPTLIASTLPPARGMVVDGELVPADGR